jgi:hypothetical protein
MKDNMKSASNQVKMAALRLAEIKATDIEDLKACAKDVSMSASLDLSEAMEVAKAVRAKYLPNLAKQAGISDNQVRQLVNLDEGAEETADFAEDTKNEDKMEMHHFEDDEKELNEDFMEDEDEVEDSEMNEFGSEMAKFEIEVPADMVDAAQKAVQEALDNLLGGEDDMDSEVDMDDDFEDDSDEDMDFEDMDDDDDDFEDMNNDDESDMEDMEDDSEPMHKLSNGVKKMSKNAQASRRAEREEILRRLAADEEVMKASTGFKYNNEMANFPGEVDYPTMTMQSSEGNSLKDENPTYAEQKVPTNNPGSLQFPDVTKATTMPGKSDGSLEYAVDWDRVENPSEGFEIEKFEVPSQMTQTPRKTTVANKVDVECVTCGHKMALAEEEMDSTDCPSCDGKKKEEEAAVFNVKPEMSDKMKVQSSLDTARIKTAYSCSSKLALAGIIDANEIDAYADQMLSDNLKADAMIRQTKLLLKSAQSSTERIVAAAAEKMNTRTASNIGISTTPAFSGSLTSNSAALDIQSALKGTWTMPNLED